MNLFGRLAIILLVAGKTLQGAPEVPPQPLPTPFSAGAVERTPDGRFRVSVAPQPTHYYQLYRSPWPDRLGMAVDMQVGGSGGTLWLKDNLPSQVRAFFRVRAIPRDLAEDADSDGLSDVIEMGSGTDVNPFNPARRVPYTEGAVRLPTATDFDGVSHRDNFPGAPNVQEVKFLIYGVDTTKPELYFLNYNKHPYHYYFARYVLNYRPDLSFNAGLTQFNGETYWSGTATRKNLAGSLVVHENWQPSSGGAPGVVTMEFWPSDPVPYYFVQMAYDMVSRSLPWLQMPLAYHAASEPQRAIYRQERTQFAEAEKSRLRTITTEQLFGQTDYTMLNPGVGFGQLVVFDGSTRVSAKDVVIFRNIPNEITRLAGIITELPQTPLSHINLKAKQNDTPNAYVKGASGRSDIAALIGKFVRFETTSTGYDIREASQEEVDTFLNAIRPAATQYPVRDLTKTSIRSLAALTFTDSRGYGAKTSNLAELRKISFTGGVTVPDGYGVPFYFYDELMKYHSLYDIVRVYLEDEEFMTVPEVRAVRLKRLRKRIEEAAFPPNLQAAITSLQNSFPAGTELRCRSSTNNEDLTGYSGAGLYESYSHRPDEGNLAKSIKQVYASLWLDRAFDEREFFCVDHLTTAMGVLVHRSFDGEQANGVGVTKNLIDPNWTGYYVNAQLGENLVTNPGENALPEEFLIAQLLGQTRYTIQYVAFSNLLPEGGRVLSTAQAELLADQMAKIHAHFRPKYNYPTGFAMELEWKILSNGALQIKQARPWID
jgi:pyruvate, water dikinase